MIQYVQPNLNAVGRVTFCLEYASRGVFNNPAAGTNAWNAWLGAKFKHFDNIPNDVAVPMWYSYTATLNGVTANYGHVTVNVPGVGIYSSPWQLGTTHAVLSSITEVERIYGCKYVGWSEDILNLRVVGGPMGDVNTVTPTDKDVDDAINLTRILAGRPDSDLQALLDLYRPLLKNNFGSGTITMLNNFVTDMKPPVPTDVVPYTGPQLYLKKGS